VALITGANSGLGLATAELLTGRGATVLLACRNAARAEVAAEQIRAAGSGDVAVIPLDLASLASIAAGVTMVRERWSRLDLLINNAGVMAIDEARTEDGFEMQFGVNHLGHFALTAGLLPHLLATPGSRIVTVTSMVHRLGRLRPDDLDSPARAYRRWPPYYQSKLANLLFTAELHRRLRAAGTDTAALAAHPGGTRTGLAHAGSGLTNRLVNPDTPLMQSPRAGALPIVRAAIDPSARSGELYGPRWYVRGAPVRETPSRRARDADAAVALWARSEELTGLTFDAAFNAAR
jgi:protochlorophyllide reductase